MPVPTRLCRLAFAAAGVFVLAPLASAGHVTFMEPARHIQARLTEEYEQRDGSVDRVVDEEMANSSGLSLFDEEVVARIEPPRDPLGNSARVSQRSTVGEAGIDIGGRFGGSTSTQNGFYRVTTIVDAIFDVNESVDYELEYVIGRVDFVIFVPSRELSLVRLFGDEGTEFDESMELDGRTDNDDDLAAVGSRQGTLAPGRYRFRFASDVESDIGDSTNYSIAFRLSPADGGPGPNPIPLPPAAWAALATAGGFGGLRAFRRRVARRTDV